MLKDNGDEPIGDIAVVDANRIESRHDPRNPNSGKVMKNVEWNMRELYAALIGIIKEFVMLLIMHY